MLEFLSDPMFKKYSDFIYDQSGIHFSDSNRSILESRLKERLRQHNLEKVEEYFQIIRGDDGENRAFLDSITTNLTRFFRNQAHYDAFINHVIPDLIKLKRSQGKKTLNLWSAGCSTGEEVYTNAMVLKEHLPPDMDFLIVGSDLSLKSLMKAQMGFYPSTATRNIPPEYLSKYFDQTDKGYQIKDSLKQKVKFDYHNLKYESSIHDIDVLFCRNVLIYFDEAAQNEVVNQFWKVMRPHSYLFIGHSESLFGMSTQFEFIKTEWACLYGKQIGK